MISVGTDTGIARARQLFEDRCAVLRYPLDFSRSVERFLDRVRPTVVGLVELELWPNFIDACKARSIPIGVVNGRLSERSFRGYSRFKRVIGSSFRALEFAAVQDASYAERFEAMGVHPGRCLVTGSMKWDAAPDGVDDALCASADALAKEMGIDRSKPLLVAGSTGPGEEAMMHAACPEGVQLACAPRKPERFGEAAAAMPGCARRSTGDAGEGGGRFLLDTIGELRSLYALADLVVVGRSFNGQHGSDPIEPAALGKPVIIGPDVADFAQIVATMERAGGLARADRLTLPRVVATLMGDVAARTRLAERAIGCVARQRGASERHAALLRSLR
ncbi:MAG: glycosyltransferase N-terminal domain-containing protein [Planctomycetota bacterium]